MVDIYMDAATLADIERAGADPKIAGATTNPSLMKKAGITNYRAFAKQALEAINGKTISFEVLADDLPTMERQAREIASWGANVYVKIPVTDTHGRFCRGWFERLRDLNLNVTAVMCREHLWQLCEVLRGHHIISVFCGRITDTGAEIPVFHFDPRRIRKLWASTRDVGSVIRAEKMGFDIITMTPDLIAKLPLLGKDLGEYSRETVQQFYRDGQGIEF